MSDKPIDSTAKIQRKIQSELSAFRRDMSDFRQEVNARFDAIKEHLAGTAAIAIEARGVAERLKERRKRLEDRQ